MAKQLNFLALLACLFSFCAFPAVALDNFLTTATYRVVNVKADDPIGLNVRDNVIEAQSLSETTIVGQIAWNAKGIVSSGRVVEISGSSWRHIRHGEIVGWVNEKYLAEDVKKKDPSKMPAKLDCSGTEPFWSLKISNDASSYTGANWQDGAWVEDVKLDLMAQQSVVERGPGTWVVTVKQREAPNYIRSVIEVANPMCSDGMSNQLYPYNIILLKGRVPGAVHGCCMIDISR